MSEHKPYSDASWRLPELGGDTFVVASWAILLLAALFFLRAPAAPGHPESAQPPVTIQSAATLTGPQFYPYVRPGASAAVPGLPSWTPPARPRSGGFFTRLSAPLKDDVFFASDYGNANSFYGGDWIDARSGGAFLEVKRQPRNGMPFTAAEMQTAEKYHYGRYEVIMKPASGSGLVTAFFTYTGPWFGDPHDEIDIEFLGSDTTKVHFNYFRNGKSIKPASFDLPFDAAEKPHLYAFEWRADGVTWSVEDVPYYATVPGDPGVPVSAGKVMFSAWTGKKAMEGWHGPPSFHDGSGAQFNCVSFTPEGHDTPSCRDIYRASGAGSWTPNGGR